MIYNKVELFGSTIMDISSDTVSPSTLKSGETAHDASGNPIVGEYVGFVPSGTISISNNGMFDVSEYASAAINVPASAVTSGTLTISEPGDAFDVTSYSYVSTEALVKPSGTLTISSSGTFDAVSYAYVSTSGLVEPTGTRTITDVGIWTVSSYYSVSTSGLVKPTGIYTLSSVGTYNVSSYYSVSTSGLYKPTGTLSISSNGTYSVSEYASVAINVAAIAAGTIGISANGLYDVTEFASAAVAVPTGGANTVLIEPYSIILQHNYFDNGRYVYQASNSCKTLWWAVESGVKYRFMVGESRGTRFRAAFFTEDVSETNVTVAGTTIVNVNNPGAGYSTDYTPPSDGYVGMTVDNAGHYDVTVYCMRLDLFTGIEDSAIYGGGGLTPVGTIDISINGTYDVTAFASAVVSIPINEDNSALLARTISSFNDATISVIGSYAFAYCSLLETVNIPSVSVISNYAFTSCSILKRVSVPNVTSIASYAFYYCSSLTQASFSKLATLGSYAFGFCSRLSLVNMPKISTFIPEYAFYYCSSLTSIIAHSSLARISRYAFYGCYLLSSVIFENVSSIYDRVFFRCSALSYVSIPKVNYVGTCAFSGCRSLASINLGSTSTLGSSAFRECSSLLSLYIGSGSNAVCTWAGSDPFLYTPMSQSSYLGVFGSIYVPSSLYASYRVAAGWSAYAARITSY